MQRHVLLDHYRCSNLNAAHAPDSDPANVRDPSRLHCTHDIISPSL